jgi:hypothetical protein
MLLRERTAKAEARERDPLILQLVISKSDAFMIHTMSMESGKAEVTPPESGPTVVGRIS